MNLRRELLKMLFSRAIREIMPRRVVTKQVQLRDESLQVCDHLLPLSSSGRIHVIAAGKAAGEMAHGLHGVLGDRVTAGVVLSNTPVAGLPSSYETFLCTHPLPTRANVIAAEAATALAGGAGAGDIVICLISGGASSIMAAPARGISIEEKAETARLLMLAGADISELNCVRKHLSRVKGGGLLRRIAPARCVTLALSDVPGDDPAVIASGPTSADPTDFAGAWRIISGYGLEEKIPESVRKRLQAGLSGAEAETLKPDDPLLATSVYRIVGSNRDMLLALERELRTRGCHVLLEAGHFSGEAREFGTYWAERALQLDEHLPPDQRPFALLRGGETTVTVRGSGRGGRNSETALAAALTLEGNGACTILCAGTDGIDGPTDAAGAVADGSSVARGAECRMTAREYLEENDSYHFFEPLGDLVITGPTGTNVMDVAIAFVDNARDDARRPEGKDIK